MMSQNLLSFIYYKRHKIDNGINKYVIRVIIIYNEIIILRESNYHFIVIVGIVKCVINIFLGFLFSCFPFDDIFYTFLFLLQCAV